jgi:hypothetical protein
MPCPANTACCSCCLQVKRYFTSLSQRGDLRSPYVTFHTILRITEPTIVIDLATFACDDVYCGNEIDEEDRRGGEGGGCDTKLPACEMAVSPVYTFPQVFGNFRIGRK